MLTDLQGYTDTSTKSTREEIVTLIRCYNQLMAPIIEFYGGTIIKTIGDAFLCTFESATDAVICAIIIQLVLRDYNKEQANQYLKMNTRVVVHSGDVSIEQNDIYGDAVNVTARIEGLDCFPGGTIGISETTYLLMDKNEVMADKIGPKALKGIPEPVTVFRVPLEKQKLKEVPPNLSKLVGKLIGNKVAPLSNTQLTEWTNSVHSFLKEKNWGENLSQLGANLSQGAKELGQKLAPSMGNAQKQIAQTLGQKSILEQKGKSFQEARLQLRVQAFLIDLVLISILTIGLNIGWWTFARVLYGPSSITYSTFSKLDYDAKGQWSHDYIDGESLYLRKKGIVEWVIGINLNFPMFLIILYFAVCWKIRGASIGQAVGKTAVTMDDGSPLPWGVAFKRSVVFFFSILFLGIGAAMIFVGEKKTYYDKLCRTKVVE